MLIAVGTALVTIEVESIVAGFRIKERDRRDSFTMGLIFVTIAINTACDIGIVVVVIHSTAKGMAAYGTLDNSHYGHILAKELYALIASGHHITPYLPTPIFGDIMFYWIGKRKVHSTHCVARQKGKASLMCVYFAIAWRYSDLLTNFRPVRPAALAPAGLTSFTSVAAPSCRM